MGSTGISSTHHKRPSGVACLFQPFKDDIGPPYAEYRAVFNEAKIGSGSSNNSEHFEPEARFSAIQSGAFTCWADILTGEASANNVNCSAVVLSIDSSHISQVGDFGPVLGQDFTGIRLDFSKGMGFKACRLEGQGEAPDTGKQIEHLGFHFAPKSGRGAARRRPGTAREQCGNRGGNRFASDPTFNVSLRARRWVLDLVSTLLFVEISKDKANRGGGAKPDARFNSGKWLQNSADSVAMGTMREQILLLPERSVHAKDRGTCVIRFRLNGVQHSIATGIKQKREAEAKADGILARWLIAHNEATPAKQTALQAEIEAFIESEFADVKKATKTEAVLIMRRFAEFFPFQHAQEVSREVFRKAAKKYRGEASSKYWANILSMTRRFSKSLVGQKRILEDFTMDVPMPPKASFGRREEVWGDAELEKVLGKLEAFDREVLMVMRWTGLDSSDVAELGRKNILKDSEGNWIIKKKREKAKTEEETVVQPISSKVLDILLSRQKAARVDDRLFGNNYATPRSFTTSLLGRVRRAAGPTKDLKSLRHTYATYHAERGVPLDVLRIWLGHAKDSRVLDRIYLHRASTARFMD